MFDDVVLYVLIITWYVTGVPRYTCLYRLRSLGPEAICLSSKTSLPSGEYKTTLHVSGCFHTKAFVIFEIQKWTPVMLKACIIPGH